MGYETKLIVIMKSSLIPEKFKGIRTPLTYASILATFDMCKMGDGAYQSLLNKARPTKHYIFADDGDTMITEDKYGDRLKEFKIPTLLKALKDDAVFLLKRLQKIRSINCLFRSN